MREVGQIALVLTAVVLGASVGGFIGGNGRRISWAIFGALIGLGILSVVTQ